ncbi:YlmC/YmxH family sporulation protein [Desertibacillus haloalkaliphilus]|uniref:YlmC/YmxH family sporulation protein n=1 Tax=Desertibacillus haloalkaliphilus TaxID=1328930 RepID=UPI001C260360|nr:YlmC/YmxH family sporulation protein [Desertibacillus haloalkaliphilus]MBU8907098.1 YlmC/YmxH family sporulation protein [Desertibacillus haloalkaliphilus]
MMKISDMQTKDIVNIDDGSRLGNLGDLDINLYTGQIEAIIINGTGKMMSFFGKQDEVIIPWSNIIKIGADCILVQLPPSGTVTSE